MVIDVIKKYGHVVILSAAIGAIAGFMLKPEQVRVEEKLKVVEVQKELIVYKDKVIVQVVRVKDIQVQAKTHKIKTETRSPDGMVVYSEIEDTNVDSVVREKENSTEVKVVEVEKQVVVEREKLVEKVSTPVMPSWHVGLNVGIQPSLLPIPTTGPILVGVEVQRHIIGPVWLGAWVNTTTEFTSPQIGLNVSLGI